MPRNPHGDSPWNPGPDEIPDSAPAKKQALVVPNFGPGLDSQSYLNACSLKRLPQVSCIKHPSLPRQFLENSIRLKRQGSRIGSSFLSGCLRSEVGIFLFRILSATT